MKNISIMFNLFIDLVQGTDFFKNIYLSIDNLT